MIFLKAAIAVCVVFGLIALIFAHMPPSSDARVTFRMAFGMCAAGAIASVLMLLGTPWLLAMLLAFVVVMLFYGKLGKRMNRNDQ